jgi:NAD(P)H-hydrate epimerase
MDRLTIRETGIPGSVLMETAGRGATRILLAELRPRPGARVTIVCGPGNNGGDGYVMARYLREAHLLPTVLMLSSLDRISGDALLNLRILQRTGVHILEVPTETEWKAHRHLLSEGDLIVDAILGTGLRSPVKDFFALVIGDINAAGRPVLSVDIPSGLNADTGQPMGVAVRADMTVTFGYPKIGEVVYPGAELVGRLFRIDIGIPAAVSDRIPETFRLTEPEEFRDRLFDERPDIHKGHRGHLLVLAGSTGKTGAATLTALGALRAGAGLVTAGIASSLNPILEVKLTEPMTAPLPETERGTLALKGLGEIRRLCEGKTAVALGPGLGTHPETASLVCEIVTECPLPMVIDADGINALAGHLDRVPRSGGRLVLTPHPGEMARLTGLTGPAVQAARIDIARRFAQEHDCHLVLKGARTLVAAPEGRIHVIPTGNPVLASGGSGDVLTGVIGGLLARGWEPAMAAVAGAYLHGLAADLLAQGGAPLGHAAGELLSLIPAVMAALARGTWPLNGPPPHQDLYLPL